MNLIEEKQQLRRTARGFWAQVAPELPLAWGQAMTHQLTNLPQWRDAQRVFFFVSTKAEPDTHPLLNLALSQGKELYLPRLCREPGRMEAAACQGLSHLVPGRYGIPEPDGSAPVIAPHLLDLVIAPCVMASSTGQRLGHGGGYYDRFLSQCRCPVLVLCPSALLRQELPCQAHDQRVDGVITEQGVIIPSKPGQADGPAVHTPAYPQQD